MEAAGSGVNEQSNVFHSEKMCCFLPWKYHCLRLTQSQEEHHKHEERRSL